MSSLFQFPEICITEASAGSGKTYALAKRYVQLLLHTAHDNPQAYKNILAITFTNKASLEMKTRILFFLKKTALRKLSPQEEKELLGPLGLVPEKAATLAYALMESLIRHYHFFSVKTIDSFINTLLVGCAFKINLSARFKIQRNAADYLEQSLDQWMVLGHHDKKVYRLLDDFVHQYLFLENRSGWFPKQDLLEVLKVLFSEFNTYQKPFLTFPLESGDLYLAKKRFLELAQKIHALAQPSMNKRFLEKLSQFLDDHPVSFDLDDLSTYFSYPEFPANKGVEVSRDLELVWKKAHAAARDLCLAESYGVFNPYVMIFQNVHQVFAALCAQEDILFLEELNKKAAMLIEEGISVSELYYRLAVRFHHYLIDEFQDTSLSQWQNLSLMVHEALSSGGTLFLVGDKKQAIYSFRGGESRLFDELTTHFPNAPVRRDYLTKNWRSHRAIVEFNNLLFAPQNLRAFLARREDHYFGEDVKVLEDTFQHAHQDIREDLPHGFVQVWPIKGKRKQDREAIIKGRLLETIADVRCRFALKDMAILTRSNAQVQQVTQWLLSEGIYAQSERTSDIKNHPLIAELMDFLRFLHSPIDNVAFARFLLGDILSKASNLTQEELRGFLFECRQKKDTRGEFYLYKEFRQRYGDIWQEYVEDFFNQAGIYPVYELVVSIYGRFGLQAFQDAQGFLMHFLELIKRREEFSCDVESFIDYFDHLQTDERFVPIPAQDAVQVLTVHKAKGLEFAVVMIPFLEMTVQTSKGAQGALSYVLDVADDGLRMQRLKKTYGRFSESLQKRYEEEYKDSFAAELNNVYVALTRAVWELYVMIPERTGNSINPAQFLIPDGVVSMGEKVSVQTLSRSVESLPLLKTSFNRQWVSQLKEEFPEEDNWQAKGRQQGALMHFCLSQILRTDKNVHLAVDRAIEAAKAVFGLMMDEDMYRGGLLRFLSRKDVGKFFEIKDDTEVFCEQEIVNRFGDTKRIDRLMIFKNKIWIIDFKTGRAEGEKYHKQMKEYEQLVGQLYPKYRLESFIVYLDYE
ncbi:MAG: UvrD-helicase domain-containing protein [Candidatus Omnitrophica bacterium]|nr:UvrD-helicase domain-containing protein [Candidatus Omnitrophota bacterium]